MKTRIALGSFVIMSLLALPAFAGGQGDLQRYLNDAATKAKAAASPVEKRQILETSFHTILRALDATKSMPFISKDDVAGINRVTAALQEKQDELAGRNGYVRVSDTQLNAFSNYVVQDVEQADGVITISLLTLVLIILLILIIL
jgi:hypothetical protein